MPSPSVAGKVLEWLKMKPKADAPAGGFDAPNVQIASDRNSRIKEMMDEHEKVQRPPKIGGSIK